MPVHDITVDDDVWTFLLRNRLTGDDGPNGILRRLLLPPTTRRGPELPVPDVGGQLS